MTKYIFIFILAAVAILGMNSYFIVGEGRQAVVTEFGKPVGDPVTSTGLHFKKPFVQEIRYVDKRILSWDGDPTDMTTKDKKFIFVDTTARWVIVDALKFIRAVKNTRGAKLRLDSILDSNTRNIISNHRLVEVVRNGNDIFKQMEESKKRNAENAENSEDELFGDVEKVEFGREALSVMIAKKSDQELSNLGIKLVDVQLRRISYEKSVEQKVYERMISERQRTAEKIRSIGKGEKAKIEGRMSEDLQTIQSEGYKKAQEIKGKGEAASITIYAKSLSADPKFYEFVRTLEAYKNSLSKNTKFLFSTDNEFLQQLK